MELPADLRAALDAATSGVAVRSAVERLVEVYRTGVPAAAPILSSPADVAAYAAYRMPATYAAVRVALAQLAAAVPDYQPRTQLDLGGGTGAAVWAAAAQFGSIEATRVVDQVPEALNLGRQLAARASSAALRSARWDQAQLASVVVDPADLVTISYVIGEMEPADQAELVRRSAAQAGLVVVVEPGTPAGFERIRAARSVLLAEGLRVVAPCPHQQACPIVAGRDWCHFAARVARSRTHRQLKGGELGYEDEKFSYVAALAVDVDGGTPGRVLRRPTQRKGMVTLTVCAADGTIVPEIVSKRAGERYRAARDLSWGDAWLA